MEKTRIIIPALEQYKSWVISHRSKEMIHSFAILDFGKHKNKSVPNILKAEPVYLLWCHMYNRALTLPVFRSVLAECSERGYHTGDVKTLETNLEEPVMNCKIRVPKLHHYKSCVRAHQSSGVINHNTTLNFGKHQGIRATRLLGHEPDYLLWCHMDYRPLSVELFNDAVTECHKRGYHYDNTENLETKLEEPVMANELESKKNEILMMVREDYSCVDVIFNIADDAEEDLEQKYTYRVGTDLKIGVCDIVVVDTSDGMTLAKVVEEKSVEDVLVDMPGIKLNWVVDVVDFNSFYNNTERDDEILKSIVKSQRKAMLQQAKSELTELLGEDELKKLQQDVELDKE